MLRRSSQGVLVGLVLLGILATVGSRAGWVSLPFERPEGHAFWRASRAAGFAAYAALSLETVLGLFLSTDLADRWIARARTIELHRWLSATAIALTAAHALALLGDRYIRFDALDVLVPFLAPHRPIAVGLGGLAAYAAIVVHASFALRSRIGQRAWRALHYLSFAAFFAATAHGLLAGTDAGSPWIRATYAAFAVLVLWLTFYRAVAAAIARARPPLGDAAPARSSRDRPSALTAS